MLGNPAGERTATADGTTRVVRFALNDRGRRPDLIGATTLSPDGVPVRVATSGVEGFTGTVDETFVVEGQRARSASRCDRGDAAASPASPTSFHLSTDGTGRSA